MKKRILLFVLALSMVLSLALGAVAAEVQPEEISTPEVQSEEVPTPEVQSEEVPTPEAQSEETQPAETQPAETQPAETQPAETQPAAPQEPNFCGDGIMWTFEGGTLTINGNGAMDDFTDGTEPWRAHQNEITALVLKGGVTYVGAYSFKNYDALKTVDFGTALTEIGPHAFASCDGLTSVSLPASFKIFGERCFQSCKNLTIFRCEGKFPSFKESCLWDTYGVIYYPADRPWKVATIAKLEEAFKGRIEFLDSNGVDHYISDEPAQTRPEEPDETTPRPTTPAATTPETTPPTEEPRELLIGAIYQTEEPTQPENQVETMIPGAVAVVNPEVPEEVRQVGGGIVFGAIIVLVVLTLVLIGALIFRGKKGRYSRRR